MDQPQPATHIVSNNSSALNIPSGTDKQCCSRAIDICFYCIRDCIKKGQLLVFWRPGTHNLADYPTKHHPTYHRQQIHPTSLKPMDKDLHNAQDKFNSNMWGWLNSTIPGYRNPIMRKKSHTKSIIQKHDPPFQIPRIPYYEHTP